MTHKFSFTGQLKDAFIEPGPDAADLANALCALLDDTSRAWADSDSAEFAVELTIKGHLEGSPLESAARLQDLLESLQAISQEPIVPKYKQVTIREPRAPKPAKVAS